MKKIRNDKKNRRKKYSASVVSILLVLAAAIAGIGIFLKFYNSYIDETLYAERLSQMREVTTQLFSGLEDVVGNQWKKTKNSSRRLMDEKLQSLEDFQTYMKREARLEDFDSTQSEFIAVDQNGMYYTQKGEQGLLNERDYFGNSPEQISFVSNSLTYDESRMFFMERLSKPLVLENNGEKIQIIYYGISQNMEELNPYFECNAYDGNNSVYVVDSAGLKLFSSSGNAGNLLKGYNIYNVLGKLEYLHGSSFEEAKKDLDKNKITYSNAVLNGEEIYYSLYQMENAAWTLIFLVPSEYVAMNTVKLINVTVQLVLIFAVALIIICVTAIVLLMRNQQKAALEVEKKNNAVLEKVNNDLKKAVSVAERASRDAEAASKAKSDFLANMSHDIRTPMNAIVGITGLMEHENDKSDKMTAYIDKVQLSSRHLLGLINDILDMSRIESKEVTLNIENVSLAEQLGQIDSIIRAQTNEHNQNFHIHINEIVHEYLICDGVRLRQMILNLLSNAVKYTPDGGDITLDFSEVSCKRAGYARYICTVTDNGYGMSQEFMQHILEPFTRAENSVTNKVQGTGLGMAITKNIVDLMGGEIHVDSEIGQGSRFEIIVTLQIDKDKECMLGEERILLISAEEKLVTNVKASVSETPVKLYAAATKEEANEWLRHKEADIILLSGCAENKALKEMVESLRKNIKNALLILCLDYVHDDQLRERIVKSGVDGIVQRPFFMSNLETAIARIKTDMAQDEENASVLQGMNFLCAEDNELNAEILREILQMYNAECTIYPDGEKLVEAFKDVKPGDYDAILMDVQMPKMNGLDATRAIRSGSNPLGKTIPIIAMTANAFSEDVQHCIGAGMDAHIAKPLDIAVLEKTLRGFVSGGGDSQTNKYK